MVVFCVGCRPTSAFWQRGNQSYMTKKQVSSTNKTEHFCLDFGNEKLAINLKELFSLNKNIRYSVHEDENCNCMNFSHFHQKYPRFVNDEIQEKGLKQS